MIIAVAALSATVVIPSNANMILKDYRVMYTTEVISTESTGLSDYPSLAVDPEGNIHVAWWDLTDYGTSGSDADIFYKRYEVGSGWTTTEVVSTESTEDCEGDVSLAVEYQESGRGLVHIAWTDSTAYGNSGNDIDIVYKRVSFPRLYFSWWILHFLDHLLPPPFLPDIPCWGPPWSPGLFPAGLEEPGCFLPPKLYDIAVADPNIILDRVSANNVYSFDLNSNWTIPTYPGIRSPMTYPEFRQALAWMTDKNHIVNTICNGLAERIDQPLPANHKSWGNLSYWSPNYPYEFDNEAAAAALQDAGFAPGSTPNPYYDPIYNWSATNIRTYPPGHSQAGMDLDPLIVCVRTDDSRRLQVGRLLIDTVRKHGIPVNPYEGNLEVQQERVNLDHDYHIYTGAYTTPKLPTHIAFRYHSDYWRPNSLNYVTGVDGNNSANYPRLDDLLDDVWQAPTFADAVASTQQAMGLFTELCVTVPLWSDNSYVAYDKNVLGVVNMEGYGLMNPYTFMKARTKDGSPITVGTVGAPQAMNIIYSVFANDYACLDCMNMYGSLDTPPYNLAADQSGFVQEFSVGVWDDDGELKTKITKVFRGEDDYLRPHSSRYFFSAWYQYAIEDGFHYPKWEDVHHININSDTGAAEIFFDSLSYWHQYAAGGPVLPMDLWMQHPELTVHAAENFTVALTGSHPASSG